MIIGVESGQWREFDMVWIVPLSEGCGADPEKESDALLQQVSRVRAAREKEDVLRNR